MQKPVSDPYEGLIPISAPISHVIAALPPSQDTTPDQLAFFNRPSSIPFVRHSPLPAAALAPIGATAASTSTTITNTIIKNQPSGGGGSSSITLTMPVQYVVSGSPGDIIGVQWVPVPSHYALMGPTDVDALIGMNEGGANSGVVSVSATPSVSAGWALYAEFATNNVLAAPPGWTALATSSSSNIYNNSFSSMAAVAVTQNLSSAGPWVASMLLFAGGIPSLVQTTGGVILGSSGTVAFPSSVTAGNPLFVIIQTYNLDGSFASGVTDSLGNEYFLIANPNAAEPLGTHTQFVQEFVYVCPAGISGGSNTVSWALGGVVSPPSRKEIYLFELTPLTPGPGLPFFRQIFADDVV